MLLEVAAELVGVGGLEGNLEQKSHPQAGLYFCLAFIRGANENEHLEPGVD